MKKRIFMYISFIIYILVSIILQNYGLIDVNTLAIIIALLACIMAILPPIYIIIDGYSDNKRKRCVTVIEPRDYDIDLKQDIENRLNDLNNQSNIVDSVQIIETVGFTDHRKTVYIIYH